MYTKGAINMRHEHFHRGEFQRGGRGGMHRGEHRRGAREEISRGPKTFRRGRAVTFLEQLTIKRTTIAQQLEQPEFQSIQQILIGELKALDMVINEFTQLFEIHADEIQGDEAKEQQNDEAN